MPGSLPKNVQSRAKELYEYNNRANERLWEAIGGLSVDQLNVDMHSGIGSIFSTIVHMVNASWTWRSRWEGSMPTQVQEVAVWACYPPVNSYTLARRGRAHAGLSRDITRQ